MAEARFNIEEFSSLLFLLPMTMPIKYRRVLELLG